MRHSSRKIAGLLTVSLMVGCAGPDPEPEDIPGDSGDVAIEADVGHVDVTQTVDLSASDDLFDLDSPDQDDEFEFGFDPVGLAFVLDGAHGGSASWGGEEVAATFYLFAQSGRIVGSIDIETPDGSYAYRLGGTVVFSGELDLQIMERTCTTEDGGTCGSALPAQLADIPAYQTTGRYDGEQIVFSPFEVRQEAREAAPDFSFGGPADLIMVPNDGFKPAMAPEPTGNWNGLVSFFPSDSALTGVTSCTMSVSQPGDDYMLEAMSCDGESFAVGADPGPDPDTLVVDPVDHTMQFDFVDGDRRYRFAGQVRDETFIGIVIDSSRAERLRSPFDASLHDLRGMFTLAKQIL